MKYKVVLFDLDGTLLNTLDDIADSVNAMLNMYAFPARSLKEIRSFVGNGARNLIKQSIPSDASDVLIDECLSAYIAHYTNNLRNKTAPYEGVLDVLEKLRSEGIRIAVCSNKGDSNVKALCRDYFGDLVDLAAGEIPGIPKKPAPDGIYKILSDMRAEPKDTVYIGDSEVDARTAINAGLAFIGVSWGFRDRDDLITEGAELVVDTADELLKAILTV